MPARQHAPSVFASHARAYDKISLTLYDRFSKQGKLFGVVAVVAIKKGYDIGAVGCGNACKAGSAITAMGS